MAEKRPELSQTTLTDIATFLRDHLTHLIRTGSSPSYQQVVARVLLKLDRSQPEPPPSDGQIAQALDISRRTVIRIKVVSISKREKCTRSKTRGRADFLIWLHKGIEEKGFEGWNVFPLARSSGLPVPTNCATRLLKS
jgi:hypothetical protein